MQWQRKFSSFKQQSLLTLCLLLPAWLLTGFTRLLVLTLPFKWYAQYLGTNYGLAAFVPLIDEKQLQRALHIGRAVRIASNYTPWSANCQAQAIAVRILFGLFAVPYSLHYGLAKDPKQTLKAHAWVCSGFVQVTGGYGFDEFTVVAVFGSHPTQPPF